jgi:alpha-beta hydrolase superfamily lysophospholipase
MDGLGRDMDERLMKEFPRLTLPVLIMHGTADKVTNPANVASSVIPEAACMMNNPGRRRPVRLSRAGLDHRAFASR